MVTMLNRRLTHRHGLSKQGTINLSPGDIEAVTFRWPMLPTGMIPTRTTQ